MVVALVTTDSSTAVFSGTMTDAIANFNITKSPEEIVSVQYLYPAYYSPSSGTIIVTGAYSGSSRNIYIEWKYNNTKYAELSGSFVYGATYPQALHVKTFTVDNVSVNEALSDGSALQFFIIVGPQISNYSWSSLQSSQDTFYAWEFDVNVANPPRITQYFPVHYFNGPNPGQSGSTTHWGKTVLTLSSRDEYGVYPYSASISNASNLDSLTRPVKLNPGYDAIGWNTTPGASVATYGSAVSGGSLYIPPETVPSGVNTSSDETSGLKLYAVWRKIPLHLQVCTSNGVLKDVSSVAVVTAVHSSSITTKPVTSISIFDGTNWKSSG